MLKLHHYIGVSLNFSLVQQLSFSIQVSLRKSCPQETQNWTIYKRAKCCIVWTGSLTIERITTDQAYWSKSFSPSLILRLLELGWSLLLFRYPCHPGSTYVEVGRCEATQNHVGRRWPSWRDGRWQDAGLRDVVLRDAGFGDAAWQSASFWRGWLTTNLEGTRKSDAGRHHPGRKAICRKMAHSKATQLTASSWLTWQNQSCRS